MLGSQYIYAEEVWGLEGEILGARVRKMEDKSKDEVREARLWRGVQEADN